MKCRRVTPVALVALVLATGGCRLLHDLQDHLEGCHNVDVDLVNDEQTRGPVNLLGPDEVASPENLVASGESRRLMLCLEIGHSQRFRAMSDGRMLGNIQCPISRSHYDGFSLSVVWTPVGLQCRGW